MENLKFYFKEDRIDDFATFLYLKKIHLDSKSTLFEYTPDLLASKLDCNRNTASSLVRRLMDYGWVRKHRGFKGRFENLVFINPKNFKEWDSKSIQKTILLGDSAKEIKEALYLIFLKYKQSQFDRVQKLAQDIKAPANKNDFKKSSKILKKLNLSVDQLPDKNAKFQVSIKKIAQWFNCSVGKAHQIIKSFKARGLIYVERCSQVIAKSVNPRLVGALLDKHRNAYYTGKYVVLVSCNSYKF